MPKAKSSASQLGAVIFPDPREAGEEGLVGVGGDLEVETLCSVLEGNFSLASARISAFVVFSSETRRNRLFRTSYFKITSQSFARRT